MTTAIERALYAKLTAAGDLTGLLSSSTAVYSPQAPQGATPPYVVFQKSSGVPNYTLGALAYEDDLYIVKGVVQSPSAAAAGTIATEINDALTDQTLTITGYKQLLTRRISDIDYVEDVGGQLHQHRGGIYRIQADPN